MTDDSEQNKILIVEDEESQQEALKSKLELEGFIVKTANDGTDGIEQFKTFQPNLVILDLMMPGKTGLEVLKEIRQMKIGSDVKIVILSNLGTYESVAKCMEYDAVEYYVKADTSLGEIVDIINKKLAT
jgi:DNA-binding response OmpR family regulator